MERRNFAQILREAKVDIGREYARLYEIFYISTVGGELSLRDYCANCFMNFPFRGTCLSLNDFDDFYEINFEQTPPNFDLNYLINFCEYTYNLVQHSYMSPSNYFLQPPTILYMSQVKKVIDLINYIPAEDSGITIFVPKSAEAIAVSEIAEPSLSYKIIEYNHHTLKGNLDHKLSLLKNMADDIEPHRKALSGINKNLSEQLFQMLNKFVRHSHSETPYIQKLSDSQLEEIYDDIYQMWLLAKLELDNVERKKRFSDILKEING